MPWRAVPGSVAKPTLLSVKNYGVAEADGVVVGVGVLVSVGVRVDVAVLLGVNVSEAVGVREGVAVGIAVGASPCRMNSPTCFHSSPTKICT